jgi:hypothetical protein
MTFLIALLGRWGVPERFRRALALAALALAAFALLALLKRCYDGAVIDRHQAKVEAQAAKARERAADERASDAATDSANEKELHDAIDSAPKGGELSPAAHALACQRLRKLGRIPPACRPGGGD